MPTVNVYYSQDDAAMMRQATELAGRAGLSLSAVMVAALARWVDEQPPLQTQLYWTPDLPKNYVAVKPDGSRWLVSVVMGAAWKGAVPYTGNDSLRRVSPVGIEQYFQPPADHDA